LKLDSSGEIPDCDIIADTSGSIFNTTAVVQDSGAVISSSDAMIGDTSVLPQDSSAELFPVCCYAVGDSDCDGILDDGDSSGVPGDNPCPDGETENCDDNCIDMYNPNQEELDGDGLGDVCDEDIDGDGILNDGDNSGIPGDNPCTTGESEDCDDNCLDTYNPDQEDNDQDGLGDACDPDDDNDGIPDTIEGSDDPDGDSIPNWFDNDSDGDGIEDIEEAGSDPGNPADTDGDETPDYLDLDSDDDTIPDEFDNCRTVSNVNQSDEGDEDGIGDACDNCPNHPNGPARGTCREFNYDSYIVSNGQYCTDNMDCDPGEYCEKSQADNYPPDGNGIGDACECEADFTCDGDVDADDVTMFLADFGRGRY